MGTHTTPRQKLALMFLKIVLLSALIGAASGATAGTTTFDTNAGTYTLASETDITITSSTAIRMCSSVDGVVPACAADASSCTGTGVTSTTGATVTISDLTTSQTIKALGCGGTGGTDSAVVSKAYVISQPTTVVTSSIAAGVMSATYTPVLASADAGTGAAATKAAGKICYRTDGTAAACNVQACATDSIDQAVTAVPALTVDKTIKAIGCPAAASATGTTPLVTAAASFAYTISCVCPNGVATTGSTDCSAAGATDCASCNDGYKISAAAGAGSQTCPLCTSACAKCAVGARQSTVAASSAASCVACAAAQHGVLAAGGTPVAVGAAVDTCANNVCNAKPVTTTGVTNTAANADCTYTTNPPTCLAAKVSCTTTTETLTLSCPVHGSAVVAACAAPTTSAASLATGFAAVVMATIAAVAV